MSIHHSVILAPAITEKNTNLRSSENKYVFEVRRDATKLDVKAAVEAIFNVQVESVNTLIVKGKKKRQGHSVGYRSDWKKAFVKLAPGQAIDKFGEV